MSGAVLSFTNTLIAFGPLSSATVATSLLATGLLLTPVPPPTSIDTVAVALNSPSLMV
jgi:hypothetical protein